MPPTPPPFELGQIYSRQEINSALGVSGGRSAQSYLPQVGEKVVCGCFSPDVNPELPLLKVLVGHGSGIVGPAMIFENQRHYIPVFIKRGTKKYEYVGDYKVNAFARDDKTVIDEIRRCGTQDVVGVLYLVRRVEVASGLSVMRAS
jgi:hypothetical protein